jgi:predicted Zn-dependent protease
MKIPPRIHHRINHQRSTPAGELPLHSGLFQAKSQLPIPELSKQPSLLGNPLAAIEALEQWRAHEEGTQREAVRWNLDKMPLQVVIEPYPGDEAKAPVQSLWLAMKQWEAASHGMVRFALLEDTPWHRESADIRITWSSETTLGRDYEVGHTQRTVQGKRITRVVITLIQNPIIDGHLSPQKRQERLYATILHETGHALGLEHSEHRRDVMYYRGWQNLCLTQNDIEQCQRLYSPQIGLQG